MTTIGERLAKARAKLFGTAAVDTPTPFELRCDCGHTVAGIRRPRIQIAICSACGKSLFALPVNLYPAARRSTRQAGDAGTGARTAAAGRELSPGSPSSAAAQSGLDLQHSADHRHSAGAETVPAWAADDSGSTAAPRRGSTKRSGTAPSKQPPARSAAGSSSATVPPGTTEKQPSSPRSATAAPPLLAPPRISIADRLRRVFTPFRLLTAGCLSLLLLTAGWMIHRQQLEAARRTWRREFDAALTAETERNRSALQLSLRSALEAAELLDKQDSDVSLARSLLKQCEAIDQLTAVDPVTVISDNAAPDRPSRPSELAAELSGRYLLFDAIPQPAPDAAPTVLLDLPLFIHGRMVRLSARSETLHQLAQQHPGQSVLFFAAVSSCSPATDAFSLLQLELDPASITLLTSEYLASEAGLSADLQPELSEILQRQAALIAPPAAEAAASPTDAAAPADPSKTAPP